MPGRSFSSDSYRYGFQGQEQDDEVKGTGNHIHFTFRGYDTRSGRMWSVDPLAPEYPWNSPYAFSENRVIDGVELEGLEYLSVNPVGLHIRNWINNTIDRAESRIGQLNYQLQKLSQDNTYEVGWGTKAQVYFSVSIEGGAGTFSDLDDAAVLSDGKHLDGTRATSADYAFAGVGVFVPFLSGAGVRKVGKELLEAGNDIIKKVKFDNLGNYDVAFGVDLHYTLPKFAREKAGGAAYFDEFVIKGFANMNIDVETSIVQAMHNSVSKGGKIHVNLDGLWNINDASNLSITPPTITHFEIRTILLNDNFLKNTKFYEKGSNITDDAGKMQQYGLKLIEP